MKDSEPRWFPSKRSLAKLALPLAAIPLLLSDESNFDPGKSTFDFSGYEPANFLKIDNPEENDRSREIVVDELSDAPIPKPPLKVKPPTASPTVTPVLKSTTEPTPIPVPTPVYVEALDTVCNLRFWEKEDIPTSIYIPTVGNINEIELKSRDIVDQGGYPNYLTPPRNIASATDNREHTIHIFGHSFDVQMGEFLPFSNIQYLTAHDYVMLKNQNGEAFCFRITNFALSGLLESRPGILGPFEVPTLALQTSYWTPNSGFLLDEATVKGKVGDDKPMDMNQYLVLIVYAEQLTTY